MIENPRLFTIKNFAKKNKEIGVWPGSEPTIWGLRADSPENGFEEAFITVGRRVLINEEKFWEAVKNLQERSKEKKKNKTPKNKRKI